jgi:hypothetical protein
LKRKLAEEAETEFENQRRNGGRWSKRAEIEITFVQGRIQREETAELTLDFERVFRVFESREVGIVKGEGLDLE